MSEQEQNIKFVLEIQKRPCLYNPSLSSYSRKADSDKAWNEVGKMMNMSGIECKMRWRNLRSVFMRHMKPDRKSNKRYYLFDYMQFVIPFIRKTADLSESTLPSTSHTEDTETLDNADDSNTSIQSDEWSKEVNVKLEPCFVDVVEDKDDPSPPCPKKRKLTLQEHEKLTENVKSKPAGGSQYPISISDNVKSFLDSLAPELEEMNSQQFKTFKRRVLVLIDDIMS